MEGETESRTEMPRSDLGGTFKGFKDPEFIGHFD
jgi:hypothetical protein